MTDQNNAAQAAEQDPINAAILILTEEADALSDCHTRTIGDWAGEDEVKARYDHIRAIIAALSKLRAPVAGEAQPVAYLHTSNRMLTWPGKLTEVQLNSGVWRPLYDRPAAPQASEAVHGQRGGDVIDDMRAAVRFAPSSAYWSERLREFFGPDAREGIDALEKQLREARAALTTQGESRG